MGIIFGLLSAIGWGSADLLAANSSRRIGNVITLLWMLIIGCTVATLYFLFTFSQYDFSKILPNLLLLTLIGLLQTIAYLGLYRALEEGKVGIVTPIVGAWALITVILSILIFHESLKSTQVLAVALIMVGVTLLSLDLKEIINDKKITLLKGVKAAVVAMIAFGLSFFLVTPVTKELSWFMPTLIYRLMALGWLALYILIQKKNFKLAPQKRSLLPLLPIGILDMTAFFAYSFGVNGSQASIVAPLAAISPLVTTSLAFLFFKEHLSWIQAFGVFLTISGIVAISL